MTLSTSPVSSREAIARLLDNQRDFLSFLQRRLASRELAQELLQEAFARALAQIDSLRSQEAALAWFYQVLRHVLIDKARRNDARARALQAFAQELEAQAEPPAAVESACQCVLELARGLKPEYTQALTRLELDELGLSEFASESGISTNNASVRAHRARAALRERVRECCGRCAERGCVDCDCTKD
jgi:RNA polymerase sigma-70 factor (ECF subfamily)